MKLVEKTIRSENNRSPNRPIYLVGESFGGCLALAVAASNPDIDLVLILAKPGKKFSLKQPSLSTLAFPPIKMSNSGIIKSYDYGAVFLKNMLLVTLTLKNISLKVYGIHLNFLYCLINVLFTATSISRSQLQPLMTLLEFIPNQLPFSPPNMLSLMTGLLFLFPPFFS